MANTIIDLTKVSDKLVESLKIQLPNLGLFTTDFSTEMVGPAASIDVGFSNAITAATFSTSYSSMASDITISEVNLPMGASQHIAAVVGISDIERFNSNANVQETYINELAFGVAAKCVETMHNVLVTGTYGAGEVKAAANWDLDFVAYLSDKAATSGYGPTRSLIVNSAVSTALKSDAGLQAQAAFVETVRNNNLGKLYSLNTVQYPVSTAAFGNSQNINAALLDKSALVMAARLPKVPAFAKNLLDVAVAVDADSGLPIQIKAIYNSDTGKTYLVAELVFNAKAGNASAGYLIRES